MTRVFGKLTKIAPPNECDREELVSFARLVKRGGEVDSARLMNRLQKARYLGFHYCDEQLAGIAALKSPQASYRDKVFHRAGILEKTADYRTELGWAYTLKPFRKLGICKQLSDLLIQGMPHENGFATTRDNNVAMQKLLKELGFEKAGRSFFGRDQETLIQLWLRPGS